MAVRSLDLNINGRIRKIKAEDPLLPLFEAVVNSIQAIEEGNVTKGSIEIEIIRNSQQSNIDLGDGEEPPISGFTIKDNGVGFNDTNLDSFCTSDSTYKLARGGKGTGRFSWLKFFDEAKIESIFDDNGSHWSREFTFSETGISDDDKSSSKKKSSGTIVRLIGLQDKYVKKCPKSLEKIADKLLEHFLSYFATQSCPDINIHDGGKTENLQALYRRKFGQTASTKSFDLKGHTFSFTGLKVYSGNQVHRVYFCGNKRVADYQPLSRFDSILGRKLEDDDGNSFAYWIFIEGEYLDSIVHEDRQGFRFLSEDSLSDDMEFNISEGELISAILPLVFGDLEHELQKVKQANKERVTNYAKTVAPEYKVVVRNYPEAVEKISKTDDKDIDLELRKILFDLESKSRLESEKILQLTSETIQSAEEYKEKSKEVYKTINEVGKASLAKYVSQRKVILKMLKQRMELEEEKYPLEEAIHQLIFPMGKESDEVSFEDQNLWIIDERLSYHSYLASDKKLKSTPAGSGDGEPDLIVFNRPIALDNQGDSGQAYESIEIVEFKRPGRDDYQDGDNPILQVLQYIEEIRENKAKNRKGRPIDVTQSTHFYCYIICDLTDKLRKIALRVGFINTPDSQGMFHFAQNHNAYIEIMNFNKMVRIAEQRNRILFQKLGLN